MEPIDWSAVVKALVDSGLTQPQIAEACACGQSTISDILNKRTVDPRVSLALKLLRMALHRGLKVDGVACSTLEVVAVQPVHTRQTEPIPDTQEVQRAA